jgi:hypothetical protein
LHYAETVQSISLYQKLIDVDVALIKNKISKVPFRKAESIQIPCKIEKIRYQSTSNFSNIISLQNVKRKKTGIIFILKLP